MVVRANVSRRRFILGTIAGGIGLPWLSSVFTFGHKRVISNFTQARYRGLIYGGVLGDALGGPVEFQEGPQVDAVLPCLRKWPLDRRIDVATIESLAATLPLLDFAKLRPGAEPYGQWTKESPAGTSTDDTRHKIVLMRMLKRLLTGTPAPCDAQSLANEYLRFHPIDGVPPNAELAALCDEGFREYRFAAQWLLGKRDLKIAKPIERLWSGIDNCSGQMLLTPLSAVYAGHPLEAYQAAYALDFVDAPGARDMAASLVAGLAAVLVDAHPGETSPQRWQRLFETMRQTDPYELTQVPFAGRPLHRWLDLSDQLVEQANGIPRRLFELLETEGKPVYWWDAHFTLLVPITILKFCNYNSLAALHIILDFRHDTDSYAQVLGAMAGAVCGDSLFSVSMMQTIKNRLSVDHGEDLEDWCHTVQQLHTQYNAGQTIVDIPVTIPD